MGSPPARKVPIILLKKPGITSGLLTRLHFSGGKVSHLGLGPKPISKGKNFGVIKLNSFSTGNPDINFLKGGQT